jgi:P2 family phage contractile tail tube protein
MALPKKLKNMNLFLNGVSYVGEITEVTVPPLARKIEGYRGAGMLGPIGIDLGMSDDLITFEWKPGGFLRAAFAGFGASTIDAELLRWVGAYQDDSTAQFTVVEIVVRGRHSQIDEGTQQAGEMGDRTVTTIASYYKLTVNGSILIEYDPMNGQLIVDGVDREAEMRAALGI